VDGVLLQEAVFDLQAVTPARSFSGPKLASLRGRLDAVLPRTQPEPPNGRVAQATQEGERPCER